MPTRAEILARMQAHDYHYALQDTDVLRQLRERIETVGRRRGLISYSDLVEGITFHIGTVNQGRPFEIDTANWIDLDRTIVGEFLGMISTESYRDHEFMASALVVRRDLNQPSEFFFKWMEYLQLIPDLTEESIVPFWSEQVRLAHAHYGIARPRHA